MPPVNPCNTTVKTNARTASPGGHGTRDQVHVTLLGLGAQLRAYAAARRITVSTAIRSAIHQMVAVDGSGHEVAPANDVEAGAKQRLLLRLSASQTSLLTTRASATGMSRSQYVVALMAGQAPMPLPQNHDAMVAAMNASTAELATVWVDLNAFLRAWGRLLPAEREYGLLKLQAVAGQLQAHLEQASSLLAELEKTRRNR